MSKTLTGTPLHPSVKRLNNVSLWLLTVLAFSLLAAIMTPDKTNPSRRLSDADFVQTGTWKSVELARYSEGHAVFTKDPNAVLLADIEDGMKISQVSIRYYDYGEGENNLRVTIGEQSQKLTYGGAKGVRVKTVNFSPSASGDNLKITPEQIGQSSVLIDHVSFIVDGHLDIQRIVYRAVLFALFASTLWLASLLVTVPQSSSGQIYQSIDILRGIGVVLVVMLHGTGYAGLPDLSGAPLLANIAKQGHYGVEIFYVVSAYTLTYSLASAVRRKQKNIISLFWNRRFNRILPTFLFCILAAVLLRNYLSSGFTVQNVIPTLLKYLSMGYVFERDVLQTPIGHSVWWSISTEFQFYIVMPLLFLPVMAYLTRVNMHGRQRAAVACALIVGGILVSYISRGVLVDKSWVVYTVLYHFDAFAIGIATAILMMKPRLEAATTTPPGERMGQDAPEPASSHFSSEKGFAQSEHTATRLRGALIFGLFAGLVLAVAGSQMVGNATGLPKNFVSPRLFIIAACALVIYFARKIEDKGASFAGVKWLRILGLLSFLIYLVHVPVFQLVTKIPVPDAIGLDQDYYFWVLILGLIVSVLVSVLIHWIVEKPSLKLNGLAEKYPLLRSATTAYVGIVIFALLLYLAGG